MLVVLYEPEIPPNTGNIARLCAGFGLPLHLIEPLGFKLEDRYLKRAGLDYWPHVEMRLWPDWQAFKAGVKGIRLIMATTKAKTPVQSFQFEPGDALIFGPETRGLPQAILAEATGQIRIPIRQMAKGGVRSLNLATACGIVAYAALAKCGML